MSSKKSVLPSNRQVIKASFAITVLTVAMMLPVMIIGWAAKHIYNPMRYPQS